jgi:RNA polymerase sigma-70 factor (ECF subfamily)
VVWSGGEPAVAFYLRHGPTGPHLAWSITVLGLCGERISAITSFLAPALFARFGLPDSLD